MIDKNDYDYEIYEIFKDQFVDDVTNIENSIDELESAADYKDAVNNLFRIFHGIKANCGYFEFEEILPIAVKVEKMLSALRHESGPADIDTINWLLRVHEQCRVWAEEMEGSATEFSKADSSLLEEVKVNDCDEKPSAIMKKLSVIYLDENKKRSAQLVSALQGSFLRVQATNELSDFENKIIEEQPNICIINFNGDSIQAAKLCHICVPEAAVIIVLDKVDRSISLKLGVEGIYHILTNPIVGSELKRELFAVTNSHFTARRFLITNQKIKDFIQKLQPLNASILQIQQICNDEESSIKDLVNVVKVDSIISGMVLKSARNPMYGLEEINTVDHAVSIFGKTRVQAIALSTMADRFSTLDLSAYNIDEQTFSNVAALRLTLMIKWYSKVSISSLAILSTTAILSNIGQLLLAEEISKINKKDEFLKEIDAHGIQFAEEKLLHTTTALVSSDILSQWQLDKDIVDSIRFSDNPQNASKEIQSLCLANHVVCRLIELNGTIHHFIPESIVNLLQENGLSVNPLEKALDAVVQIANKTR